MTQGGFCVVKQKDGSSTSVAPERMSVPSSNPESVVLDPSNLGPYSTGVTSTHKDSTAAAGLTLPTARAHSHKPRRDVGLNKPLMYLNNSLCSNN